MIMVVTGLCETDVIYLRLKNSVIDYWLIDYWWIILLKINMIMLSH